MDREARILFRLRDRRRTARYRNRTACGRRLTRDTLGVAHRKLPCGTKVNIRYRGRTIAVPVIDRGPYSSANWDLTSRTARRLDFSGRGTIGVDP